MVFGGLQKKLRQRPSSTTRKHSLTEGKPASYYSPPGLFFSTVENYILYSWYNTKVKRTPIKKVGKQGKKNADEYKNIKQYLMANPITYCEAGLPGCLHTMYLQVAHRRRRNQYYDGTHSLSDPNEWIIACQKCHQELDRRTPESFTLTEAVFARLRP